MYVKMPDLEGIVFNHSIEEVETGGFLWLNSVSIQSSCIGKSQANERLISKTVDVVPEDNV